MQERQHTTINIEERLQEKCENIIGSRLNEMNIDLAAQAFYNHLKGKGTL